MKQITCITCPIGCRVSVETKDGQYVISGNKCAKGENFVKAELTSPMRSLSTTVRTVFANAPVLPVKTNGEVPKEKIKEIMRELSKITVTEKTGIGETIVSGISGTNCDIIAVSNILREESL